MIDASTHQMITQAIGILASIFVIAGWSSKKDKKLKFILCISAILFSLHFYMLGAFAAMVVCILNIFRIGFSIKYHKSKILCFIFIAFYWGTGYVAFESPVDLLPVISATLNTISMYFLSSIPLRYVSLISSSSWLVHNIIKMSIGGIITEIFVITGVLSAIIRIKRDQNSIEGTK